MSREALLKLAERARALQIEQADNLQLVPLPNVTSELLEQSFQLTEQISLSDPWAAWRFCFAIAHAAREQNRDRFLIARATWNLGWATNECVEPRMAEQALNRAKDLFESQNEPGWVAACDWQLNALPWTKPDFKQAKRDLEFALVQLKENGPQPFIARCQLSLAYANILISTPETLAEAEALISAAEQHFSVSSNLYWVLRSRLLRPSLLPRVGKRIEGVAILEELLAAFAAENATLDAAKAKFQLALNYSMLGIQTDKANNLLRETLVTFRHAQLKLWEAHCLGSFGILFSQRGQYPEADEYLKKARKILQQYGIQGMLADNLNDSARLAVISGNYSLAKAQFQRALEINEMLGSKRQRAIAKTNLGYVYAKLGDMQNALIQLEDTQEELSDQLDAERLADCRLYLSSAWMRLGRYQQALRLVHKIKQDAPSELRPLDFEASLNEAHSLIGLQLYGEANQFVTNELQRWSTSESKSHLPLLLRTQGLILFSTGDPRAEEIIRRALSEFRSLGMSEEIASCMAMLGQIHSQAGRDQEAVAAWEEALQILKDGAPEIRIQSLTNWAELLEKHGQEGKAHKLYQAALQALTSSLYTAWQPSIFSWHLASLSIAIDKALNFFVAHQLDMETILLIEKIKTHAIFQSSSVEEVTKEPLKKLNLLHRDIDELLHQETKDLNWLDELIQTNQNNTRLEALIDKLETEYGRLQRLIPQKGKQREVNFDIRSFQSMANQTLGKDWLALEYYFTNHEIVIVQVAPDSIQVCAKKVSPRLKMALAELTSQDLTVLANELLPDGILSAAHKRRFLIISPHKDLWGVPWAGLQADKESEPLVHVWTPVILPSLSSFSLLRKRTVTPDMSIKPKTKGLFIGLSKFGELVDLPLVKAEMDYLQALPGIELIPLYNNQATRSNAITLINDLANSGNPLDFIHIATHITYDARSNHLCQIHLSDGPVWFNELFSGVQLPPFVYLSACNGAASIAYEGGEQVGMLFACLSKGAQAVIGSQRAIGDEAAFRLMKSFYDEMIQHKGFLSETFAKAQSNLHTLGAPSSDWMHAIYMGLPELTLLKGPIRQK
jgi:tetratricopeptide (TPR) repeat protein